MTHSKLKTFLAYLEPEKYDRLKEFALQNNMPMTRVVREAIGARLSSGDLYTAGFNEGIAKAIESVNKNKAAQMRFPNGESVADLINKELNNEIIAKP
jgi:hypothetical protein